MKVKRMRTLAQVMDFLKGEHPGNWDATDPDWRGVEEARLECRRRHAADEQGCRGQNKIETMYGGP